MQPKSNASEQSILIQVGSLWSWQLDHYEAWEYYEEDACSRPLLQAEGGQVQVEELKKKNLKSTCIYNGLTRK